MGRLSEGEFKEIKGQYVKPRESDLVLWFDSICSYVFRLECLVSMSLTAGRNSAQIVSISLLHVKDF